MSAAGADGQNTNRVRGHVRRDDDDVDSCRMLPDDVDRRIRRRRNNRNFYNDRIYL